MFVQNALNKAGIEWDSRYVPDMMNEALSKGMWRSIDSGYTPQPGDAAIVDGTEHVVLVGENNGVWQAGVSEGAVYYSPATLQEMFGDKVTGFIASSGGARGTASIAEYAGMNAETINPSKPIVEQEEPEEATFGDKFYNSLWDSAAWGGFRTAATLRTGEDPNWKITQEELDTIQKDLSGDYAATLWVAQSARSSAQLRRLTQMKKEDLERQQRVDASPYGWDTTGTLLGLILDPLNYVPLLGTTGKVGKLARYAKLATANAAFNLAERGATQALSGYQQNYIAAATLGVVAGAGLPAVLDMAGKGVRKGTKYLVEAQADYVNMKLNGQAAIDNAPLPASAPSMKNLKERLKALHDPEFAKEALETYSRRGVYSLSQKDAKELLKELGAELPDNVKGIFDDESGISLLIKENIKDSDDALRTILHERGAHGLKYVLSKDELKQLYADLEFRAKNNPSPAMIRALKRAQNKGDMEEVLGYLVEEMKPSNPLLRDIRKKIDKRMNALGAKGRMTDEDFYDTVKRAATSSTTNAQGYRTLPDGTTVYNRFRFSEKSILNPQKLDEVNALVTGKLGGFGKMVSRWKMFATPWTLAATSASGTLRNFIGRSIDNPYMNKALDFVTTESQKRTVLGILNAPYNNYMQVRDEALKVRTGKLGRLSPSTKHDFDKEAVQCYNAVYGNNKAGHIGKTWAPEVLKGAEALKKLRETQLDVLKHIHQILGDGTRPILPENWTAADEEMWRFIDDEKRAALIARIGNTKETIKFLQAYGEKAAKLDVIRKRLEEVYHKEWEAQLKKGYSVGKEPQLVVVTDAMVKAQASKDALAWATGVIDQNTSTITRGNIRSNAVGHLDFLQHRFAMDTSTTMKDPWGFDFSFDESLRAYEFDDTIPFLLDRTAGEVALYNLFSNKNVAHTTAYGIEGITDNIKTLHDLVENELQQAVNNRQISKSAMREDLKALSYTIDKLRGISSSQEPKTYWDAFTRLLSTMTYASSGANMGVNQLAEVSGTMGYAGADALTDLIPVLGKSIREMCYGKQIDAITEEAQHLMFGETTYQHLWQSTRAVTSDVFSRVDNTGSRVAKGLDVLNGAANTGATFVSTINGLQGLTNHMIISARKHTLIDVAMWCNGKDSFGFRKPFSTKKLAAAGIKNPEAFRKELSTYMLRDKDGVITSMNIAGLQKENPTLLAQLRTLVDNQSRRCITQESIGTTNLLKESSPFWRAFFQFKDFTMRATHSQTMRALYNQERDDFLALAYGTATNAAALATLTYGRAWAMYGDNDTKRQNYLDKSLSIPTLMLGGFLRSPVGGSALSTPNDILEATGASPLGLPTLRTTVNRTQQGKSVFEDPKAGLVNVMTQIPALDTLASAAKTATLPFQDKEMTQKQLKEALRLLPGQNNLLLMKLREELFDELHLKKR